MSKCEDSKCLICKSPQEHTAPTLGSKIARNLELIILYVCLKISRQTGSRGPLWSSLCTQASPRLSSARVDPGPSPPFQGQLWGPACGAGARAQSPARFRRVGRGGVGGRGRGGPAGPGSAGSKAGAQAACRSGHEPWPCRVGGPGPLRWDPRTQTSNPEPGPRRAGAPRGQGHPGAATSCRSPPGRRCVLGHGVRAGVQAGVRGPGVRARPGGGGRAAGGPGTNNGGHVEREAGG